MDQSRRQFLKSLALSVSTLPLLKILGAQEPKEEPEVVEKVEKMAEKSFFESDINWGCHSFCPVSSPPSNFKDWYEL